ncbi:MAG TPA: di-heme oxidoredictase family protein, partial [Planctomycetaceae bacterium]
PSLSEIEATAREWKTPPLWGVADSAPYLHDGRAATLDEAIRLHAGQAEPAAERYAELSGEDRGKILAFLGTLRAPQVE